MCEDLSPVHVWVQVALQIAVGVGTGVSSVALACIALGVGGLAIVQRILVRAHDAGVGIGSG